VLCASIGHLSFSSQVAISDVFERRRKSTVELFVTAATF
jgi:hypothetical protein